MESNPKLISIENCDFKNRKCRINSPRTLKICRSNGILIDELYYTDFKDYCELHPELTNLPGDMKKYRYDLIENFREKTINQIKEERRKLMKIKINENSKKEKDKDFFFKNYNSLQEGSKLLITQAFDERMNSLIKEENRNLEKLKNRQKKNIEYLIEQELKYELMNKRNREKERIFREKEEKNKKEKKDKVEKEKKIKEAKNIKVISSMKRIMKNKIDLYIKKRQQSEQKRIEFFQEHNRKREEYLTKQKNDIFNVDKHRSQLNIFMQMQAKEYIKKRLLEVEKGKKQKERIKHLQEQKKEYSLKKREKSAELFHINMEKRTKQISQLIKKINKKHEDNNRKLNLYYKELKKKAEKVREFNLQRKAIQENSIKSMENKRRNKIKDYFTELEKKEQYLIMNQILKSERVKKKILHENEICEIVKGHKYQIQLDHEQKRIDFFNKMDKLDKRIDTQKKRIEFESLKNIQESYAKQTEKDAINQRIKRMKEYRYELNNLKKKEKEKRIQLVKIEQQKFKEEKEKINEEYEITKNLVMSKFNNYIKNQSSITTEMISRIYPDDKELYAKVKKLEKKYEVHSFEKYERGNNTPTNKCRTKSAYRENIKDNIEKKVDEFRRRIRAEITKEIENERVKEIRRIKEYEEAKTLEEKKMIEIKNNNERNESKQKINDKNDNLEKIVDEYRKKLMSSSGC